jgi:hypothetical protein
MGKKITRANKRDDSDFVDQKLLASDEVCSFEATDIEDLLHKGVFPSGVEIMPPNSLLQSDFISRTWVAFPEFPFTLGLKYPFSGIIAEFFEKTGISYIQAMPVIWKTLYWIQLLNDSNNMSLDISDVATMYDLQTFGSSRFILKVKTGHPHLVLKTRHNDKTWKGRFFFVKRSSVPQCAALPYEWVTKGRTVLVILTTLI